MEPIHYIIYTSIVIFAGAIIFIILKLNYLLSYLIKKDTKKNPIILFSKFSNKCPSQRIMDHEYYCIETYTTNKIGLKYCNQNNCSNYHFYKVNQRFKELYNL